jgi:hypothetical protein
MVDYEELKTSFINFKYEYALIAFGIITINRFIMGYKWRMLLKIKNINISLFAITKIYYIGNFLGLFLPPTVGTDVVRAYYISKDGSSKADIISSIIMERLLGFLALFIAALLGFILFINIITTHNLNENGLFLVLIGLTIVGVSGFLLSLNQRFNNLITSFLRKKEDKKYWKKIVPKFLKVYESYISHKNFKLVLVGFLILTFAEIFTVVLWSYTIALGLDIHIPLIYFLAFMPLVLFLIRLPISFDGFGINEGLFVYFLSLVGIQAATGFSVGIINHFITIIGILPGGLFYAFNRDFKKMPPTENISSSTNIVDEIGK